MHSVDKEHDININTVVGGYITQLGVLEEWGKGNVQPLTKLVDSLGLVKELVKGPDLVKELVENPDLVKKLVGDPDALNEFLSNRDLKKNARNAGKTQLKILAVSGGGLTAASIYIPAVLQRCLTQLV